MLFKGEDMFSSAYGHGTPQLVSDNVQYNYPIIIHKPKWVQFEINLLHYYAVFKEILISK